MSWRGTVVPSRNYKTKHIHANSKTKPRFFNKPNPQQFWTKNRGYFRNRNRTKRQKIILHAPSVNVAIKLCLQKSKKRSRRRRRCVECFKLLVSSGMRRWRCHQLDAMNQRLDHRLLVPVQLLLTTLCSGTSLTLKQFLCFWLPFVPKYLSLKFLQDPCQKSWCSFLFAFKVLLNNYLVHYAAILLPFLGF